MVCAIRCDSGHGLRFLYIDVWGAGVPVTLVCGNAEQVLRLVVMCRTLSPRASGASAVRKGNTKENKS